MAVKGPGEGTRGLHGRSIRWWLCLLALVLAPAARAVLTIEITGGVEGALPIAVVPFGWQGRGPVPAPVGRIVADDLRRSGRFKPLPEADLVSRPTRGSQVNFKDWRLLGVDSLVIGRVLAKGGDTYTVQFQLFDVLQGRQLAGYSVPARRAELRHLAHYISDLVYETLTGQRGAFNTRIAYVTVRGQGKQREYALKVADADGHDPKTVVRSRQPLMSPAWSPDASRLAYVSFEHGNAEIYVQDLATGQRRLVAGFAGINGAPAWSPDGSRLALTLSRDGNPEIYLLTLADGTLQRFTHQPAIDTEPVWSPDGHDILFTSDRGGSPQLYRKPLSGGPARRVTFEGSYNTSADYAPDGKQIAFIHRDQAGHYRVAVLDLATGLMRVLSKGSLDESPSFAPNGSMVLFATEENGHGVLAAVSVDGRVSQRLRFQEGDVREPAWSPFMPR